jgi:hypothetical protein
MKFMKAALLISLIIIFTGCPSTTPPTGELPAGEEETTGTGPASGEVTEEDGEPSGAPTGEISPPTAAIIADHNAVAAFDRGIPSDFVNRAKDNLRIYYGHTSHGSQLMTGLSMLPAPYNSGLHIVDNDGEDLGHCGDGMGWAESTRAHLGPPGSRASDTNVVIWSWCGGIVDNTTSCVRNEYLTAMSQLEDDYPDVVFVYMTGRHWSEDFGEDVSLRNHIREVNDVIRDFVRADNRVLYDFEDVEEYDLDGDQHVLTSDRCSWCVADASRLSLIHI